MATIGLIGAGKIGRQLARLAARNIAYIFKLNKLPAGKVELPTEREALGRITIVADMPAAVR